MGATTLPSEKSISPSKWSSFRDAHIITTIPTVCRPSDSHSRVNILQAGRASQPPDPFGAERVNERIRTLSGWEQRRAEGKSEQPVAAGRSRAAAPRGEHRPGLQASLSCWCWHWPGGVPRPQRAGLGSPRCSPRGLGLQSCEGRICRRTGDFAVSVASRDTPRKLALESTGAPGADAAQPARRFAAGEAGGCPFLPQQRPLLVELALPDSTAPLRMLGKKPVSAAGAYSPFQKAPVGEKCRS